MKNITAILAVLMLIFAGLACSSDETDKANGLVDEANKFIKEANTAVDQAESKGKEFDRMVGAIETEDDFKKATDFGNKELIPAYDKMKDNFSKAGEKFEAAGKLKVNDKFKEYLEAKAAEMKKRAEYAEVYKGIPKALADSKGKSDYKEALQKILDKAQGLQKEAKDLDEKATKIQKDNPNVMKQN
ncbi:MAG: hypothetical protein JSS81_01430 [Acidobacteria bacterium]|nr:hypothetical protein [Acidobacteriota bacterium]